MKKTKGYLIHPDREQLVDTLAAEIHDIMLNRGPQRILGFRFGRRVSSYATMLYLFVKVLYVLNVVAQFALLNAFIGGSYTWWGWEVLEALINGDNWQVRAVLYWQVYLGPNVSGLASFPSTSSLRRADPSSRGRSQVHDPVPSSRQRIQ